MDMRSIPRSAGCYAADPQKIEASDVKAAEKDLSHEGAN